MTAITGDNAGQFDREDFRELPRLDAEMSFFARPLIASTAPKGDNITDGAFDSFGMWP